MLPPLPNRLSLANTPTPMRPLDRVSEQLGGPRVWLKCDDMSGSVLSGNKVRKLEFLVAEAIAKGCNTLITCGGLQSNHCRATAAVAAQLGMKCHLLLRGSTAKDGANHNSRAVCQVAESKAADGNLLLDQLFGASISVFPPSHYSAYLKDEFERLSAAYAVEGDKAYAIPTGGTNAMGLWGYLLAAQEMQQDFNRLNIDPGAVICATGSGGTQGGLTLGFHLLRSQVQVVGVAVCDSAHYFMRQIHGDVEQWQHSYLAEQAPIAKELSVSTLESYIGPGYAQAYPELLECIRWLAREEGVVLDPVYTGKAFFGMVQEIKAGRWRGLQDLVFVHTGGLFGLFPYRDQLTEK